MLEITCQESEVRLVPVDDLWVIRAVDHLAGIIINIPVTTAALTAALTPVLPLAA